MVAYDDLHRDFISDIKATARGQFVPGLDYDDVVSEMTTCLWRAWLTYRPCSTSFGSYWWSVWQNRKRDLIKESMRLKRPVHVLLDDMGLVDISTWQKHWPSPPSGDRLEQTVWHMLAAGEQVRTVIERLGITRRHYYQIIERWRREDVRESLRDGF